LLPFALAMSANMFIAGDLVLAHRRDRGRRNRSHRRVASLVRRFRPPRSPVG
jgi:hypothetical protein